MTDHNALIRPSHEQEMSLDLIQETLDPEGEEQAALVWRLYTEDRRTLFEAFITLRAAYRAAASALQAAEERERELMEALDQLAGAWDKPPRGS